MGRRWGLASGLLGLVACIEPADWAIPNPSSGARAVAIYLESEADPQVLLTEPADLPAPYSLVGRPSVMAFFSRSLVELRAPSLLEPTARTACDRQRPLPVAGIEAYRGSPEEGWARTSDLAELEAFSLPPLALDDCLRDGCVRRDERGVYYCEASCAAPQAPEVPNRAACPEGWLDESQSSAACRPPNTRSCAAPPCWISPAEQGEACEARAQPVGATPHQGPALPAQVDRPLWLPRGRYTGTVEILPGGALLGECHQGASIVGHVILRGGGRLSDLTLEVDSGAKGIEIFGTGSVVERVRIQGGEYGVLLTPGSQAELRSLLVADASWGLTAQSSALELHHFHATSLTYEGLKLESSTGTVADVVVDSTTDYPGIAIVRAVGEASGPPIQLDRAYVEGVHEVQFLFETTVNGRDLRSDGHGMAGMGIQTSRSGTLLDLERVFISDIQEDALWSRERAETTVRDFIARRAGGGLLCSADLQLERGHFEDLGGEGLKLTGSGEVVVNDLTVIDGLQGARLTPEFDEEHRVQLRRVRIDGCNSGLVRGPGQIQLEDVQVTAAAVGVQAEACWIDETLSGVSLDEVQTPWVIEGR